MIVRVTKFAHFWICWVDLYPKDTQNFFGKFQIFWPQSAFEVSENFGQNDFFYNFKVNYTLLATLLHRFFNFS